MNTYVAQYCRNDGRGHDSGYDRNPILVFHAEGDDQARELALVYIGVNRRGIEDFQLSRLGKLDFSAQAVEFQDNGREIGKPSVKFHSESRGKFYSEGSLRAAKFMPLRDVIEDAISPNKE